MAAENPLEFESDYRLNWAKKNSSLCFFPWDTIELRLDKEDLRISCCCNLLINKVQINKDDLFNNLKIQMDQGILPDACADCKREESNNGISERIRNILGKNQYQLENFQNSRFLTEQEIRITFSNKCSLACRSCSSSSSSTYAKISNDQSNLDFRDIIFNNQHFEQIKSLFIAKKNFTGKLFLHLMGGEPLLADGLDTLIDWLINNGLSEKVSIRITTSLAIIPKKELLSKLNNFAEIQWVLSIDSIGKNYHYVRWPNQFYKIERALGAILEHKRTDKNCPNYEYVLSPVFSLNNIFYIKEYFDYWYEWYEQNQPMYFVHTNLLYRTNFLDVQALPIEYRIKLKEILIDCLNHKIFSKYFSKVIHPYQFVKTTIEELDSLPENRFLWNKFLKYTAEFDRRTKTKFEEYNYKLYNIVNDIDLEFYQSKYNSVDVNKILIT